MLTHRLAGKGTPDGRPAPFPLRDRGATRRRRDGRRVQGARHEAQPPRRAQVPPARADPRRRRPSTLHAGSAGGLRAGPSQHLHDPRDRLRARRQAVHCHGVLRRRDAQGADLAGAVTGEGGAGPGHPDRTGTGQGARQRYRAPRRQAREPHGHERRLPEDRRLRDRQAHGRDRTHADRYHAGHRVLHVARAGGRETGRPEERRVGARSRALRDAHRHAAVPGRQSLGRHGRDLERRAGGASLAAGGDPRGRRARDHGRAREGPGARGRPTSWSRSSRRVAWR